MRISLATLAALCPRVLHESRLTAPIEPSIGGLSNVFSVYINLDNLNGQVDTVIFRAAPLLGRPASSSSTPERSVLRPPIRCTFLVDPPMPVKFLNVNTGSPASPRIAGDPLEHFMRRMLDQDPAEVPAYWLDPPGRDEHGGGDRVHRRPPGRQDCLHLHRPVPGEFPSRANSRTHGRRPGQRCASRFRSEPPWLSPRFSQMLPHLESANSIETCGDSPGGLPLSAVISRPLPLEIGRALEYTYVHKGRHARHVMRLDSPILRWLRHVRIALTKRAIITRYCLMPAHRRTCFPEPVAVSTAQKTMGFCTQHRGPPANDKTPTPVAKTSRNTDAGVGILS